VICCRPSNPYHTFALVAQHRKRGWGVRAMIFLSYNINFAREVKSKGEIQEGAQAQRPEPTTRIPLRNS